MENRSCGLRLARFDWFVEKSRLRKMESGKKRGRKRDDTLPPSVSHSLFYLLFPSCRLPVPSLTLYDYAQRSREIQRAFRARKAEHLSNLENRITRLTQENAQLRIRLGDPPRSATPEPTDTPVEETEIVNSPVLATHKIQNGSHVPQHVESDYSRVESNIQYHSAPIEQERTRNPHSGNGDSTPSARQWTTAPHVEPPLPSHIAIGNRRTSYPPPAFSPASTSNNNYSPTPLQLAPIEQRHYTPHPHVYSVPSHAPPPATNSYDQWSYHRQAAVTKILSDPHSHPLQSLINHTNSIAMESTSSSHDLKSILQPSHLLTEITDPNEQLNDLSNRTLPLRGDSPTPETEVVFLQTCCSVPSPSSVSHSQLVERHADELSIGYKQFCKGLMRGLELTGKGSSGRTSYSNEEVRKLIAKTEAEQCCGGVVDCTGLFDEELNQNGSMNGEGGNIPAGYLTALHAWRLMRPIIESDGRLNPMVVAEMILDSGQPRVPSSISSSSSSHDPDTHAPKRRRRSSQYDHLDQGIEEEEKFVSTNIRCERHHGLLIIGGIVDGVMRVLQSGFMDLSRGR